MAGTTTLTFQQVLLLLSLLPLLVALVGGLLHFHRLPLGLRYLAGVVGWILLLELVARTLWRPGGASLYLLSIRAVGELILLALVYGIALRSNALRQWLPALLGGFAAYTLYRALAAPQVTRLQPSVLLTENIVVLLLVITYFRKLLNELVVKNLEREPMFWVSTGLFLFCLGNIQVVLFSSFLIHYSTQLNMNVWSIHTLLSMVLYSCYALALWMRPQK